MSLEARVSELEEKHVHWDQVLTGIEGTVTLILREQVELRKDLKKEILREQAELKEDLKREILENQHENNKRFNKIEELLIQIVNNLASK